MFDNLSEKLGGILDRLTGRGALSEDDVDAALREVRRALLEADVALDVVRSFTDKVREQAVGAEVIKSVTPGQMVVKIVHDTLVETLGADVDPIDLNAVPPVPILMVGLQGSGKTTSTAKIARRLTQRDKRKVLMASLDTRRPAAMEQLAVLGQQVARRHAADRRRPAPGADRPPRPGGRPARRLRRGDARHRRPHHGRRGADGRGRRGQGRRQAARGAAGRRRADRPGRGQHWRAPSTSAVGLTGIVLTRVDGDGRGGAALSMRAVTGKPIKLVGTGEKMDALDEFHPQPHRQPHPRHGRHRLAGREGGGDDRRRKGAAHRRARCARASSTSTTCATSSARCRRWAASAG